jgi:hypothetical protein
MKIILSRKGFDNQYGRQPSPILPDGTLLSMPIPMEGESIAFRELTHGSRSYFDIVKSLKPNTHLTNTTTCHLDPDLNRGTLKRNDNWKPLFGQAGAALGHLIKQGVSKDDLFLFFGTFRATEEKNGRLSYVQNAPEVHIIYGFFQVKELHRDPKYLKKHFPHHPHANGAFLEKNANGIFEANELLSFDQSLPGAGVLNYHPSLILTKPGYSKSRWQLPEFFKDVSISYHSSNSFKKEGYFQSAAKGQEFVISESPAINEWAQQLICRNR